jgi:hypothetical protein
MIPTKKTQQLPLRGFPCPGTVYTINNLHSHCIRTTFYSPTPRPLLNRDISQAGLNLTIFTCLSLLSTGIIGMYHHTQTLFVLEIN